MNSAKFSKSFIERLASWRRDRKGSVRLKRKFTAYHQLSANEFFSMSSIERKNYSSIERRFSVHSPI